MTTLASRPYTASFADDPARSRGHVAFDRDRHLEFYLHEGQLLVARTGVRVDPKSGRRPGRWLCSEKYARKALDDHFKYTEGA